MKIPSLPRWAWWVAVPVGLLLIIVIALSFIDEPLRAYAEREVNQRLPAYTVHIGGLDLHPLTLSLDLEDVVVRQKDQPDPPIAAVPKIRGSIQWSALLSGRLVTDEWIDHPVIHFTRPQAAKELEASTEKKQSWQEALFAMREVQINEVRITNGDVTYRENATSKPMHISELNMKAENIRNVRSKPNEYPSDIHIDAVVFDKGQFKLDGHADFFADPSLAVNADLTLTDIELAALLPLTAQHQVHLSQGRLSAIGHVEYAPTVQEVRLRTLTLHEVKGDFIHTAQTEKKAKETGKKAAHAADQAANHPTLLLRIDQGKIKNSEFGVVNQATTPSYRMFISRTDIDLENWSNQLSEGTAEVKLHGLLMGSGTTQITGAFRPETKSPDFDLHLKILKTPAKSLNPVLRAHGGADVAAGVFSLFSEMSVKNGKVNGYLKPLFKDVTAYDPEQDKDKGLLTKIFEKTINVASSVLKNTPRGEVATKADLSGPVENPQASTWEIVATLLNNAFFDAVLPGLEGKVKSEG
ncbi:MAG: uncharacterized protein K0S45_2640 [Nitrospira sp.]|jgi:hypothetical protein|nr:uncharacterized protein [Nitrospira sp.]